MACFKRIVKMLISKCFNNINHARNVIDRYIHFYNNYRPHMSIGYKNTGSGASGRGRTEKDVETGKIH